MKLLLPVLLVVLVVVVTWTSAKPSQEKPEGESEGEREPVLKRKKIRVDIEERPRPESSGDRERPANGERKGNKNGQGQGEPKAVAEEAEEEAEGEAEEGAEGEERKRRFFSGYVSYGYEGEGENSSNQGSTDTSPPTGDHAASGGTGKCNVKCSGFYKSKDKHTMCTSVDSNKATEWGLTKDEVNAVVKYHNDRRAEQGASDMVKMYWNDRLAEVAQKWAQGCVYKHDKVRHIPDFTGLDAGQNIGNTKDFKSSYEYWYNEVKDHKYNRDNDESKVGHYSQMVNAQANLIGCGYAYCNTDTPFRFYVCNYAYGQTVSEINKPFRKGPACSKCPGSKCANGLCDCGNQACCYGYYPDPDDMCKCKCGNIFSGNHCENVQCNTEYEKCGKEDPFLKSKCKDIANLQEFCPRMCDMPC